VLVGQVLPLGTATWLLSLERPLVYGVFVHGMDVAQAARVRRRRWLLRQVLGGAAAVFAANRYVAGLVGDLGVAAERIHLVYPAPSLPLRPNASVVERLRGQWHLGSGPLLVTVARLVRRKGHNVVLRALEAIWREAPDVRYVVVGAGPELANLQALAAGLSKPQQVSFVGEQSDDEVAAWLALATVFVMTPRALPDGDVEGFGLVYLEAAWFGVPSVAARTGGVAEAVSDGDTGLLVPEGDVAATARAVLRLLHDDGVRRAMGERARRRVTNDFSARRGAETILRVFDRAAERARQAG
jgi:phosphatidylinositol alpha-1,6-mannosyltransferase